MNPQENFQEQEVEEIVPKVHALHTVTPLSKYLAMVLFIILPFIGGWIGYSYAPEKMVEVERIVVQEVEKESEVAQNNYALQADINADNSDTDLTTYRSVNGFSLSLPDTVTVIEADDNFSITAVEEDGEYGYTIYYRKAKTDADLIRFAHDVYGEDCIVTKEKDEYLIYPDRPEWGDCSAFKTDFLYDETNGVAFTWNKGQDLMFPIYEDSYGRWSEGGENADDLFYDFIILDSITFSVE